MNSSTSWWTGSMAVKSRLPAAAALRAVGLGAVLTAMARAPAAEAPRTARRLSLASTISRKYPFEEVLHVALRQALSHFRAQVTGLRLPRTWLAIGRKLLIGVLLGSGSGLPPAPVTWEDGRRRVHSTEPPTASWLVFNPPMNGE